MARTWEQMTEPEKIEELRNNVLALTSRVNTWVDNQKRLSEYHNELKTEIDEHINVAHGPGPGGGRTL
jgi:hypothetical protein